VILLAIDSAGESCSAALWDAASAAPEGLLAWRVAAPARTHGERLIALIEAVLAEAGLRYAALGALAVNHGPGSFTGVRSAVAAARGLALAADLGVLAVSSLEALAAGLRPDSDGEVLAALDARRGEVYAQRFGPDLRPLELPCAIRPEQAAGLVSGSGRIRLVGSGAPLIQPHLPAGVSVIETLEADARLVARCAARRLAAGERPVVGTAVRPLYLRAPDARPAVPLVAPRAAAAS
jgi:tRNA threonylcarbamoyladenosine biosynthesis protein TsaB